jgi:uncharacterized protein YjiS (DUF1127 family)
MIKHNLQNLVDSNNIVSYQLSEPQYLPGADATSLFARSIRGLRRYLAESSRKHSLEAENRKAIEHLHSLTDEHLRDIGITRMDISRVVRFGKDNI